jgi:DNA uptake protein ComE-like DNA-binding protein
MADAIGNARGIDLNSASEQDLENVGGLGKERAERLVRARPFNSFDDLKRIEGFSDKLVSDLRDSGATIGSRAA